MASHYDTMQVCQKGHMITSSYDTYPNHRQDFCYRCGSKTTTKCAYCNENIRGFYHVDGVVGGSGPSVPFNCHRCGKPYPWKTRAQIRQVVVIIIETIDYFFSKIVTVFKK
mgnify:CR=1 FL=1